MHGTEYAYARLDCRCDPCRETHNARVRRNRAERLEAGRVNHGTRSGYDTGCRCEPCRSARQQAAVRLEESARDYERRGWPTRRQP